jgi:hypothetical protein
VCAGLKDTDDKVPGVLLKPILRNSKLKHGNLSRHHKVRHLRAITWVELPSVRNRWIGNCLAPRTVRHGHQPLAISDMMPVTTVWLQHIRGVGT